ncbi:MAG: class I SAM-dependent methyltransferase [Acidimicrobiia bacterium]|nr:class I SAM-dependent methyltransferase [Acidimicrobiia bacterium]
MGDAAGHAAAARAVWSAGDYATVGDWFADASRSVLDGVDLDGRTVLDVATGTGAVAIEAARRGASVTGVDITPELLAVARQRATVAEVEVTFVEGSFTDLSEHRGFDLVTSSFGVMLAAEPEFVARELAAAARRGGGVVAVVAWAPGGAFGSPPPAVVDLLGDQPPVDLTRWAVPESTAEFFASTTAEITEHRRNTIDIPFPSVDHIVTELAARCGPWMALLARLDDTGQAGLARDLLAQHFEAFAEPTAGGVTLQVGYAVTQLTTA